MHAHWVVMRVHVVISGSEGYTCKLHQSTLHFSHFFLQSEALTYSQTAVLIKCHGHGLFESNTHQKFWDKKTNKNKKQNGFPLSVTCTSLKLFQNPKHIQRLPVPVLVTSVYCIGGTSLKTLLALCSRRRQSDITQNLAGFWLEPR